MLPDADALAAAAAALFAGLARRAVARRGRFAVALAGGGTPLGCYRRLAEPPHRDGLPWAGVHVFWSDERCVAPDDPRSNERAAREALIGRVTVPAAQVHPIRCAGDPEGAATAYEQVLAACFAGGPPRLDLALLGLGADGHTASLFPGSPALDVRDRFVIATGDDAHPQPRLTFTFPAIERSPLVVVTVSGAEKRDAMTRIAADEDLPGARLRAPRLLWLVDEAAAP